MKNRNYVRVKSTMLIECSDEYLDKLQSKPFYQVAATCFRNNKRYAEAVYVEVIPKEEYEEITK